MISRLLITICILFYSVGSPITEFNSTHVFNPDWTPHVRIHEVWQLLTNSCIGLIGLWLLWVKRQVLLSALLSLSVMGSFLVAYATKRLYGGSMKFLDGSENLTFGLNFGLFIACSVSALLLIAIFLELRNRKIV